GTESFTYILRDSGGGSATGTVTFEIQAVNDAPPVANLTLSRNRGGVNQNVLSLSDLPENPDAGESLSVTVITPTQAGGIAEVDTLTQAILYTPPAGFVGTDTISYTVSDGSDLTASGTITINVTDYESRQIKLTLPKPISDMNISGITLSGTDLAGNTIQKSIAYNAEQAEFNDVLPGEYTIQIPAIPFMQNAESPREILISSGADDGDTTVESGVGRLRAEYVSMRDWLRSTPKNRLLVAIAPGESHRLVSESSQADFESPEVSLDGSGALLTIQHTEITTDDSGNAISERVQATIDATNPNLAQQRGEADGMLLYRIATDQLSFTPVLDTNDQGEGEQISVNPLSTNTSAEGESIAPLQNDVTDRLLSNPELVSSMASSTIVGSAATVADLFVPSIGQTSQPDSVLVLPTNEAEVWQTNIERRVSTARPISSGDITAAGTIALSPLASSSDGQAATTLVEQLANDRQTNLQAVDRALTESIEE
ncbi:MAG: Ig-like domain-containing protein, partial [Rubripirellula sp.]|nr:Ig-like domain-containing protein [Rubripirellula sp.]